VNRPPWLPDLLYEPQNLFDNLGMKDFTGMERKNDPLACPEINSVTARTSEQIITGFQQQSLGLGRS